MKSAAILIPFDPYNRRYLVVRSTDWHPEVRHRHRLKAIGGVVEEGESPLACVLRELEEEQPGWFTHIPGNRTQWGEPGAKQTAVQGLVYVGEVDGLDGWTWHVFTAPTDIGIVSFRRALRSATESTPEAWSLGDIPDEASCLPGFRACILAAHRIIAASYPSLRLTWAELSTSQTASTSETE